MKILTREHSLEMGIMISEFENSLVHANELTIQNPIISPNGMVNVCVLNIDTSNSYMFKIWQDCIELYEVNGEFTNLVHYKE